MLVRQISITPSKSAGSGVESMYEIDRFEVKNYRRQTVFETDEFQGVKGSSSVETSIPNAGVLEVAGTLTVPLGARRNTLDITLDPRMIGSARFRYKRVQVKTIQTSEFGSQEKKFDCMFRLPIVGRGRISPIRKCRPD